MHPIARKDELILQELGDEVLIYDLRKNKAVCLNQTSAFIWRNCDGKKTALEIANDVEKKFGSSVNEDFVWFALNQLEKEDLLEEEKVLPNKFEGLSRREIIRKVGLGSMVALPFVTSLLVPTSVMAQVSCTPNAPLCMAAGSVCAAPLNCCSCFCNPSNMCG